ncbi:MAG: hypothetical protein M1405_02750, partial [Patescibacteria group bacterium]|nr:hypothetical protein [Patescibacteria group bacterium]
MGNTKYKIPNTKAIKSRRILIVVGIVIAVIIIGLKGISLREIPFPNAKIISAAKDYPAYATVSFTLKLNDRKDNRLSLIRKVLAAGDKKVGATVLFDKTQIAEAKVNLVKKDSDTYLITAQNDKFFRAGKYTLAVILSDFGNSRILTQDFNWGVLAVNTNKSIYNTNEKAKLAFSVLNEKGFNDCQASLELRIMNKELGIDDVLSSENGRIKRSKTCLGENVTYEPDYFSEFKTSGVGQYQMDLKATSANGTYEIKDYFEVRKNQDFEVERQTATRINPVSPYTVKLIIKANKDFEGQIIENLPYAFGVKADNNAKVTFDRKTYTHQIIWNERMQKGETKELSYQFKAPEKSPEFYLLGPLTIQQFNNLTIWSEARFWQIAADPTNLILLWDPANGATPSGWICISCSTGDPFFQSFIRGNATYGGTGGASTETPTVATLTVSAESAADTTAKAGASAASGDTHTHTASNPTIGQGSIIPAYKSLMVIRYNSGIPTGASAIPANAIAFFDATVPTGWTRYTTQDANYVRGDWTGTAGGSNTQTHTIAWQSLAAASTAQDVLVANGGASAASAHTHTAPAQTSTASINTEPPNITTILGKANAVTSIPNAMIGMFDGAPGTGWALKSNTGGDPFYQVFPKPAATYGTTGGAATHSHATETSGASGAPSATTTNGAGALTVAADTHTHTETVTFNTGSANVPPYTDAIFAQKVFSLSGTVRQSNESTAIGNPPCDSTTGVIDIRINGGTATTVSCSSVDSTYSATPGTVAAGNVITILLNGSSTPKANTIIRAGTSDATGADLYQDVVVARSDDTSAITNANICTFTTSMLFTCSTNNITVNSGVEFHAGSGSYTAGATLTTQGTGNLHVASGATATLDTGTSTIANNVTIDSTTTLSVNGTGGLTVNGGSITVTGTLNTTSGTPTITMGATGSISGGGNATFYNLTTSGTGTTTYSASGTNTVNNNVSVGTGTTLNLNSTISITGSLTNTTTGIINQTANSPVVTVSGTSIGGGSGNITFYRLQKAGVGITTFSGSGTNTINNTLDATAGTLTLSTTNVITVTGNVSASTSATLNQNTALTINGGSLLTAGTGVVNTTAGIGTVTINGTGNIGGGGTVTIYNLIVNGTQTLTSATTSSTDISVSAGATLALGSQNLNVNGGDFTTTTTGSITCSGCSAGTVTMSSTGSLGGGSGAITFYNLTTSGTGTTTFSGGGTNAVNNNVSVETGTTLNINSSVSVAGNFNNTTTGIIGTSAGTPTVTMTGTTKTIGGGSGAITFYNLTTSGTASVTFSGAGTNTVNNNVSVGSGTTLNINSTVTITGNITNTTSGVIGTSAGTPTVTVNGSTIGGGTTGAITFYNLTVGIAGTATFSNGGTNTINNNLAVNAGTTLNINS